MTAPAAHTSERHGDSDDNPFLSDDEAMETERGNARLQSDAPPQVDPSAEDHPMGDNESGEGNPRASSETLRSEPVRSATLPPSATEMDRGPQTPRGTVQPDAEGASEPQTGESSRQRAKVSGYSSNILVNASDQ